MLSVLAAPLVAELFRLVKRALFFHMRTPGFLGSKGCAVYQAPRALLY